MKKFLVKLFLGNNVVQRKNSTSVLRHRWNNILAIWNNVHHQDMGIEKFMRLLLAFSQFILPGTYLKHFAARIGPSFQDLFVDFYVLFKVVLPVVLIYFDFVDHLLCKIVIISFLIETLLYIPTLIFASDIFNRPKSYRRAMLLLFFNYLEIVIAFGFLYAGGNYLNKPFEHWFDPIYFSFESSSSIGFGDYIPVTFMGKVLITLQTIIFMTFVVLFLSFFSNRVENKGYFDNNKSIDE